MNGPCSVEDCEQPWATRGLCRKHYWRFRRHGDPTVLMRQSYPGATIREKVEWRTVAALSGCLLWTGAINIEGYVRIWDPETKRQVLAHKHLFEAERGPVPVGYDLDHICRVRHCLNLNHLRLATRKENSENSVARPSNRSSGVRGVTWDKFTNRWRAGVMHNYRFISAGRFDSIEEAEAAAIALRNRLFTHNEQDRIA